MRRSHGSINRETSGNLSPHRSYSKRFGERVWGPKLSHHISVQITVSKQNDVQTQMETDAHVQMYTYADRGLHTHTEVHTHRRVHTTASHLALLYILELKLQCLIRTEHACYVQTPKDTHTNTHTVNAQTRRTQLSTMAIAIKNAWQCSNSF